MINKNLEREIRVQPDNPKSKVASLWPRLQSEMVILPLGISEWDYAWEVSPPVLQSSLVPLGLKVCTTRFLWQTSVATGIKGACYWSLVCKAGQCGCFTLWTSDKPYLLKYKWNITTGWGCRGGSVIKSVFLQRVWACFPVHTSSNSQLPVPPEPMALT